MSLATLIERFVRGLPLPSASGYGQDFYSDDESDVDIKPTRSYLDPVDRQEQLLNNQITIDALKSKHKQEAEAEAAARKQQEAEKDAKALEQLQRRLNDESVTKPMDTTKAQS